MPFDTCMNLFLLLWVFCLMRFFLILLIFLCLSDGIELKGMCILAFVHPSCFCDFGRGDSRLSGFVLEVTLDFGRSPPAVR